MMTGSRRRAHLLGPTHRFWYHGASMVIAAVGAFRALPDGRTRLFSIGAPSRRLLPAVARDGHKHTPLMSLPGARRDTSIDASFRFDLIRTIEGGRHLRTVAKFWADVAMLRLRTEHSP